MVKRRDLACPRDQQGQGVVGDFGQTVRRNVRHNDAYLGRIRDIDVVESDAVAPDRLAFRCVADDFLGDRLPAGQDAVNADSQLGQFVLFAGFGNSEIGSSLFQDLAFGIEAVPGVVGDEDASIQGWHSIPVV